MAVLRSVIGNREFPLRGRTALLGRDGKCDIVINSELASRRHAMILRQGGVFFVEDLGSSNGTFLNGRLVRQRSRLNAKDRLEIGGLQVTFHLDEPPAADPTKQRLYMHDEASPGQLVSIHAALDVESNGARIAVRPEAKLRAVLEISRHLANTLELEKVLPKILEALFSLFLQADRGFLLLIDPETGQLVPKAIRCRVQKDNETPSLSRTIVNHVMQSRQAVLSSDARTDDRFDTSQSVRLFDIRSIMCVPMLGSAHELLGILQIDTQDRRNPFGQEDLDVLVAASELAARAIQLASMHLQQREFRAAAQIQKSFLPSERPEIPELMFFDYYSVHTHVGGDYYDYIPLPGNRLAVALGDVSGKGVAASLLMARLSAAARFCLASEPTVPDAMRALNRALTRAGLDDRFITFVVVVIDLDDYMMTVVNAGHMPPLRQRPGCEAEELGEEIIGPPLAVVDTIYDPLVVKLEPGDTLVLYTDGVTEARNGQRDFYGLERLKDVVARGPRDVLALGTSILADVQRFAGGRSQSDDLTIVCVGRAEAGSVMIKKV